MRLVLCVLAYCLAFSQSASSATLRWAASGPGGGGALASAAQSVNGSVIVGSDLGGAYRSVNGGASWSVIGRRKGVTSTHVDAVVFHPSLDGTVFLGTGSGVFRSTNCETAPAGVCTFDNVLPSPDGRQFITAMGIASSGTAEATAVYAAGNNAWCELGPHVWSSADNGATWTERAARGLPANASIMAIRVQPGNPQNIIAISARSRFTGCDGSGLNAPNRAFKSTDGGATFTPVVIPTTNADLQQTDTVSEGDWAYVEDVKFDAADPRKLWATITPREEGAFWQIDGELWMSSGASGFAEDFTWQSGKQTGQLWPQRNGNVKVIDLRRQHPWDWGTKGVWEWSPSSQRWSRRTTDDQFTHWNHGWSGFEPNPGASLNGDLHTLTAVNDTTMWWVDAQFAFKTVDGGQTFDQQVSSESVTAGAFRSRHLDNAVAADLAPSAASPGTIYAGYFDLGCWASRSATSSAPAWTDCNGPRDAFQNSFWSGGWQGWGGNTTAIAPDPASADVIWAVLSESLWQKGGTKIGKSTDGGKTYKDVTFDLQKLSSGASVLALSVEAVSGGGRRLWAVAGNRLYKLDANTTRWQAVTNPCNGGLMVLARAGQKLLAGGTTGICRSTDGGVSWTRNGLGIAWSSSPAGTWWNYDGEKLRVSDISFDPANSARVWLTVYDASWQSPSAKGGVYRSTDGGLSWRQVTGFGTAQNFQRNFVRTIAVSPTNPNTIVAGRSEALVAGGYRVPQPGETSGGAWVSRDGGATWQTEDSGLAWPFISKLRFTSGATPRLYGVSPGQGIVYSTTQP